MTSADSRPSPGCSRFTCWVLEANDLAAFDYLLLRDRLRTDAQDRTAYERTKRDLALRDWSDMNAYADAKTDVIEGIKTRARAERDDKK